MGKRMGKWIKPALAILAIILMLWLGWFLVQGISGVLRGAQVGDGEPDPMFAQEAELPTRPPELDAEVAQPEHPTLDDYVPEVETPVDKTAAELIREAEAARGA